MAPPRVVIVGGGFAGLYAAFGLDGAPVETVLVDKRNHHLFQPLLYQVASAALSPADITQPLRHILAKSANTRVLLGEAVSVDLAGRRVLLADGELPYDHLLVASGATHSYFGKDEWRPHAPGLKTIEDALEIRRRVLGAFESAERETDEARRRGWLGFVVVGAGPTGVELAGALAEIARRVLAREFRAIDPAQARVTLLEAAPRVLPPFDPELGESARRQLEALGVEVVTGCAVTAIEPGLVLAGGRRFPAKTVLWAAGVQASALGKVLRAPLDKAGRVKVLPDLSVPGHPEVFVAGDLAAVESGGRQVPGVAPAAIQMGGHAAANILRRVRGEATVPFVYRDKGSMATIGRHAAVAQIGTWKLSGWPAWLAWLVVHILFLIGFRNRLLVLFEWAWAYLTFGRGARLITGGPPAEPGDTASGR